MLSKTFCVSDPKQPAFILIAPPIEAGIPAIDSSPVFPSRVVSINIRAKSAPAIACNCPSVSNEYLLKHVASNATTTPSIPSSPISRFCPFPRMRRGVFSS